MPVGARRPFTEIFEVAQNEMVREAARDEEGKYKGSVNQVYINELPSNLPELYIRREAFITTKAYYSTGSVTINQGSTTVTGLATAWTSSDVNDFWLKVASSSKLYRMTFNAGTQLTFQNSLTWVEASVVSAGYSMFQDRYAVASDFNYIAMDNPENPNSVYYMVAGSRQYLTPWTNEEYNRNFNGQISSSLSSYTVRYESNGVPYLHIWPGSQIADIVGYSYIPVLTTLIEYTTGTVTFASTTAVVGSGTLFSAALNSVNEYYIRNDADGTGSNSLWHRISSIGSSVGLTLTSTFTGTTGAGQTYTISEASKWPARFDDAILYKTCLVNDPSSNQVNKWTALYTEAIGLDKTVENKRRTGHTLKYFPGKRM